MTPNKVKDQIIARMRNEAAVNISDGEIQRTLEDCVAGQRLITLAKQYRDDGSLKENDIVDREKYDTYKRCKCGNMMRIHYEIPLELSAGEWLISSVDTDGEGSSCVLRRRSKSWPNSVWCISCNRIHRLETFKKLNFNKEAFII
jgi:hypothetical protein